MALTFHFRSLSPGDRFTVGHVPQFQRRYLKLDSKSALHLTDRRHPGQNIDGLFRDLVVQVTLPEQEVARVERVTEFRGVGVGEVFVCDDELLYNSSKGPVNFRGQGRQVTALSTVKVLDRRAIAGVQIPGVNMGSNLIVPSVASVPPVGEGSCAGPGGPGGPRSTIVDEVERHEFLMSASEDVYEEVERAQSLYPPMRSPHEGYAILAEEVDELWDEVKKSPKKRDVAKMRAEAVQVAAMALRFIVDVVDGGRSANS